MGNCVVSYSSTSLNYSELSNTALLGIGLTNFHHHRGSWADFSGTYRLKALGTYRLIALLHPDGAGSHCPDGLFFTACPI